MQHTRQWTIGALLTVSTLGLAACGSDGEAGRGGQDGVLRIATVDNRDLLRLQELSKQFTQSNPGTKLDWVTLDENSLRQQAMTDIATDGGQYDIVTIGTYEAPLWAENEWLRPIDDMPEGYDSDDILPSIREALSFEGTMYAAPFYGESSFTMYRTDLFEKAGLEMPEQPTWDFIADAAEQIDDPEAGVNGICLRGKPGWGENVTLVTAMANSHGGRWFDPDWQPQLETEAWSSTLTDYVTLLSDFGPQDPGTLGYNENLALFQEGSCGIWVDATVGASALLDKDDSTVADDVEFALAPGTGLDKSSNWLWSWSLAVPESSSNADEAKEFIAWATSKEYTELVAEEDGWANVPPGTRSSLYENQEYLDAAPFAELALESIEAADPLDPTVDPVPYEGVQYVSIPSFPSIGDAVGNRVAEALDGSISPETALKDSQWVTQKVIEQALEADKE